MNAKITQQVELVFWDFTIQALSESKIVRYLVWNFYHLFKGKDRRRTWILIGIVSLAGFLTGNLIALIAFAINYMV
jgi:hypothetical protein